MAVEDSAPGGLHPAILENVPEVAFQPAPESHLLDLQRSHETPAEEFRTLRTRLNHLQTLQPLHTVVISSPSPAEGKTFTAVNLALAESHLTENRVLLGDFDLRRPLIHNLFQIERAPGLTDYLTGEVPLCGGAAPGVRNELVRPARRNARQEPARTAEYPASQGFV